MEISKTRLVIGLILIFSPIIAAIVNPGMKVLVTNDVVSYNQSQFVMPLVFLGTIMLSFIGGAIIFGMRVEGTLVTIIITMIIFIASIGISILKSNDIEMRVKHFVELGENQGLELNVFTYDDKNYSIKKNPDNAEKEVRPIKLKFLVKENDIPVEYQVQAVNDYGGYKLTRVLTDSEKLQEEEAKKAELEKLLENS